MSAIFSWLSAVLIGVSLGLFGSGGSIITVPALIYLFNQDEKTAIAGSLAIVGIIAFAGSFKNIKDKLVDWRLVVLFGIPGMLGTYIGAWSSQFITGAVQLSIFAVIMLLAATLMLKPINLVSTSEQNRSVIKIGIDGLVVGVVTGLVGVGGGFLIVPALVFLGGLTMHRAVATSLVIIFLKSIIGYLKYVDVLQAAGKSLDLKVIGLVSVLGVLGTYIGSGFAKKLPQAKLRKAFAIFLIIMGIYLLLKNFNLI